MSIDPRAVIDPSAEIGDDVTVGPFSIIGPNVSIGARTWIGPHVVINGPTRIGCDNRIFQFSSIGEIPQDKKFHGEDSSLEIGDRNTIREFTTINRGTEDGGGVTRIGDDNWFMAYIHIAHDCLVGNSTILANAASLAGHVQVDDHAILGGFSLVHQFVHIGQYAFTGMGTALSKDLPPYVIVNGNPAEAHGLNLEGLKRRGFEKDTLRELKEAYREFYRSGKTVEEAATSLDATIRKYPAVKLFSDFILNSKRGIVR